MFSQCTNLTSLPLLDAGKVTVTNGVVGGSTTNSPQNLTELGGFKDLGKAFKSSLANNSQTLILNYCPNLTHESLMNVINNLYNFKLNGKRGKLQLGTNLDKLTDDEIAIATNKYWTVL
jgi:hypothetical protein